MDIFNFQQFGKIAFNHMTKDTEKVKKWMQQLQQDGKYTVDDATLKSYSRNFLRWLFK